jgi:predicted DNA binding CopG/RHH family protein
MKYHELSKEEQKLLSALERSGLKSVPNVKQEMARLRAAARATLQRSKNINIRITERTLHKLKTKAAEQGIPYQTLVSSVLHQYTNR